MSTSDRRTGLAVIGCGFIADAYRACLPLHADGLFVAGAYDRDPARLAAYRETWGDRAYASLEEALSDPAAPIVLNLTDPHNHAGVSHAAIAAGRHVYSEKPLGMTAAEARGVRDAAHARGVLISGAPCIVLGEQAQTLLRTVREGRIGRVRLAYAEIDDGMIHLLDRARWASRSGKPWPAKGEFEVGCTFEHAGYALSLLVAMFGPVRRVTAFSALVAPDKGVGDGPLAPRFYRRIGCLEVRRRGGGAADELGFVAPLRPSHADHRRRGRARARRDLGFSPPAGPAAQARRLAARARARAPLPASRPASGSRRRAPPTTGGGVAIRRSTGCAARADLADALRENRKGRGLDGDFAVHITEVTEALQHPERFARPHVVERRIHAAEPMPPGREPASTSRREPRERDHPDAELPGRSGGPAGCSAARSTSWSIPASEHFLWPCTTLRLNLIIAAPRPPRSARRPRRRSAAALAAQAAAAAAGLARTARADAAQRLRLPANRARARLDRAST